MRFELALAELDARQPERMVPDLTRITALTELLNHPERTYPSVHVTGTNGKTTTTRLIESLACAHGLPTGAYTSPHLHSVTERFTLCGEAIDEMEFGEEFERLVPYLREVDARGERVTYFEALTALAFLWFADKPVSLGVFEVGMGGVWDATNLVSGDVAVLCPIALDHPELGSTLTEVATEKAGIVKEGKVAVCREQPEEALSVIRSRCDDVGAKLVLEGDGFEVLARTPSVGGQVLSIRTPQATYEDLQLQLFGEPAARNAAAAVAALELVLDRPPADDAVREALVLATSPGRIEVVARHPLVVLDGAHNPAAAHALVRVLQESFVWDRLFLVLGISSNKDVAGVIDELAALPVISRVFTAPHSAVRRTANPDHVAAIARERGLDGEAFSSVEAALDAALDAARETDAVLVTGSLYTVADARRAIVTHG